MIAPGWNCRSLAQWDKAERQSYSGTAAAAWTVGESLHFHLICCNDSSSSSSSNMLPLIVASWFFRLHLAHCDDTAISGLLSALVERQQPPHACLLSPSPPSSHTRGEVDKIGNVPGLALPFIAICFAICHLQLTIFLSFSPFRLFCFSCSLFSLPLAVAIAIAIAIAVAVAVDVDKKTSFANWAKTTFSRQLRSWAQAQAQAQITPMWQAWRGLQPAACSWIRCIKL